MSRYLLERIFQRCKHVDDLVSIGVKICHVQRLLNPLKDYCFKWGLKVNMLKTKMLVYRNGGVVKGMRSVILMEIK